MNRNAISLFKIISKIIIYIFVITLIYFLLKIPLIKSFVRVTIISLFLAYALKPLYYKIVTRGIKSHLAAIILILSLVGLICLALVIMVPNLIKELASVERIFASVSKYFNEKLNNISFLKGNYIFNNIIKKMYLYGNTLSENIIFYIMGIGENVFIYCIIPIFVYYFLVEGNKILEKFLFIFSVNKRKLIQNILDHVDELLSKYILSQLILSLIIGILTFTILLFTRLNNVLLLSVLNGLLNIIPYFGPVLGGIPIIIVAFLKSTKLGIIITILLIIIQQIEGDIISPKIIGEYVDIHPLVVIILLIVGGKLWGFMGMIIAIPIGVIIKVVYEDINYYLY